MFNKYNIELLGRDNKKNEVRKFSLYGDIIFICWRLSHHKLVKPSQLKISQSPKSEHFLIIAKLGCLEQYQFENSGEI